MILFIVAAAAASIPATTPERVEVDGATFRISIQADIVVARPSNYRVKDALKVKQLAKKAVLKATGCKIADDLFVPEIAGAVYQAQIDCSQ